MFRLLRAGGFAAATLLLSATVIGVEPSRARDLDIPAASISPVPPIADVTAPASEPLQIVVPTQTEFVAAPFSTSTEISPLAPPAEAAAPVPVALPFAAAPAVAAPAVAFPTRVRATLAQLVADFRAASTPDREIECLAGAIYFESKGEPLSGQVAVGQVIANRAKSGRFPPSFCGVVFQRSQFSFVRGRSLPPIPRASAHWRTAVAVAHIVANELTQAVAPKSLFFHARYVSPNWKRMSKVATVGNHVFYR